MYSGKLVYKKILIFLVASFERHMHTNFIGKISVLQYSICDSSEQYALNCIAFGLLQNSAYVAV